MIWWSFKAAAVVALVAVLWWAFTNTFFEPPGQPHAASITTTTTSHKSPPSGPVHGPLRVFSVDELALYDGSDPDRPLYLSILGEVYDVSAGKQYYGPGEGYHCFVGRDGSAAYMTGKFEGDGLTSDVSGLTPDGLQSVLGWRDFYAKHAEYRKVGVLAERYYDHAGEPTEAWAELERRRTAIAEEKKRRDDLLARYKDCNSKSVMAEPFFTIWCNDGLFLRELVIKPKLPSGEEERRCVCVKSGQANDDGLNEYPECGPQASRCQRIRKK